MCHIRSTAEEAVTLQGRRNDFAGVLTATYGTATYRSRRTVWCTRVHVYGVHVYGKQMYGVQVYGVQVYALGLGGESPR